MLLQISLLLLLLRMLVIMYELGSYSVAHGLHYRSPGFLHLLFITRVDQTTRQINKQKRKEKLN